MSTSQSVITLASELGTSVVNSEDRVSRLPSSEFLVIFYIVLPGVEEETEAILSFDKPGEPSDISTERKRKKIAGRFEMKVEGSERKESKGEGEN